MSNVFPLGNLPLLENIDLHGNPCTNEHFYNVRLIAQFGDRYQDVSNENLYSIVIRKVGNKIAGCLLESKRILATVYTDNGDQEQRNAAGIRSKYAQIIIMYLYIKLIIFAPACV